MEIRSIGVVLDRPGATDPVHGVAARALLGDDGFGCMAPSQAAYLRRLHLREREIGNVDVDQPRLAANQTLLLHCQHQLAGPCCRCVNMLPAFLHLGERNGRHTKQVPLHRCAHGTGVDRVVPHVGTIVDARDHQVGPVPEQTGERDVHAVGRRAIEITKAVGRRGDVQRGIERQGVRFRAVVELGRNHFHLSHVLERFVQGHNARSLVTVVVRNQYFHGRLYSARIVGRCLPHRSLQRHLQSRGLAIIDAPIGDPHARLAMRKPDRGG